MKHGSSADTRLWRRVLWVGVAAATIAAIGFTLHEAIESDRLLEALRSSRATCEDALETGPVRMAQETCRAAVEQAERFERESGEPEIRRELIWALGHLGQAEMFAGEHRAAREASALALNRARWLFDVMPDAPENRRALGVMLGLRARVLASRPHEPRRSRRGRSPVDIPETLVDQSVHTLFEVLLTDPEQPVFRRDLARAEVWRSEIKGVAKWRGHSPLPRQVIDRLRGVAADMPGRRAQLDLAHALMIWGITVEDDEESTRAALRESFDICQALVHRTPEHPAMHAALAQSADRLATRALARADLVVAGQVISTQVEAARTRARMEPGSLLAVGELTRAHFNRLRLADRLGDLPMAQQSFDAMFATTWRLLDGDLLAAVERGRELSALSQALESIIPGEPPSIDEALRRATGLRVAGLGGLAAVMLDEARARWPDSPALAHHRAMRMADGPQRRAALEAIVATAPDYRPALSALARSLADANQDLKRADALARRAVALAERPGDIDTLGWIYVRQGRLNEAEPLLRRAVSLMPESPDAHLHLAALQSARGEHDAASGSRLHAETWRRIPGHRRTDLVRRAIR